MGERLSLQELSGQGTWVRKGDLLKELDETNLGNIAGSTMGRKAILFVVALVVVGLSSVFKVSFPLDRVVLLVLGLAIGFIVLLSIVIRLFVASSNSNRSDRWPRASK